MSRSANASREALEHDDARAVAPARAARVDIERAAVAVGREYHPLLKQVAGALRKHDAETPPAKCHVAFAAIQRLARNGDGDQRGRASGLDCHTRSVQIKLVRYARAEKVLVVSEHDLIAADRFA